MIFSFFRNIDTAIEKFSKVILVVDILLILALSVLTIVLRWVGISFLWLDPLVRHLVFVSVFLGGAVATGRGSNICIDVLGAYFKKKEGQLPTIIIQRVLAIVCTATIIWLSYGAISLINVEREFGQTVFLGIHSSVLVAIIPIGFTLIAYRFFYKFIESFSKPLTIKGDQ